MSNDDDDNLADTATSAGTAEVAVEPATDSAKLRAFLDERLQGQPEPSRRAAIFAHPQPDLDAIGAMMGIRFLLDHFYQLDADCFVDGDVSHPQNKVAVQLLDPHFLSAAKYSPEKYCLCILVDTIPSHAGAGKHDVQWDIVIDHHKELPNDDFDGHLIHHHSGSAAGIVYQLLCEHGMEWSDDNELHVKVATAIWAGVITDTDFCTKADTESRDFATQQAMFDVADAAHVRKIVRYNWPMSWVRLLGRAITDHENHDGLAVVGLGIIKSDQYHALAAIADHMLSWGANVHTAVAFGLIDREYVSGCLRTNDDTVEVHTHCRILAGEHGEGGGKLFSGRYTKPLGAFAFDVDEGDEMLERFWELQKEREISKILKVLSK